MSKLFVALEELDDASDVDMEQSENKKATDSVTDDTVEVEQEKEQENSQHEHPLNIADAYDMNSNTEHVLVSLESIYEKLGSIPLTNKRGLKRLGKRAADQSRGTKFKNSIAVENIEEMVNAAVNVTNFDNIPDLYINNITKIEIDSIVRTRTNVVADILQTISSIEPLLKKESSIDFEGTGEGIICSSFHMTVPELDADGVLNASSKLLESATTVANLAAELGEGRLVAGNTRYSGLRPIPHEFSEHRSDIIAKARLAYDIHDPSLTTCVDGGSRARHLLLIDDKAKNTRSLIVIGLTGDSNVKLHFVDSNSLRSVLSALKQAVYQIDNALKCVDEAAKRCYENGAKESETVADANRVHQMTVFCIFFLETIAEFIRYVEENAKRL
jgi:hypothetical protein